MSDRIATLLDFPPTLDASDLLHVEDVANVLGVSRSEALKLTQGGGFPEPVMNRHRYTANERLPQPRPVWDRAEVERWAKEVDWSRAATR